MTIEELRARIAKFDREIDLQRGLLKRLERDKSLVQRELNNVLDPVARLPLEISSEIFLQSVAPFPKPTAYDIPMLLLHVCHAWADIALATPALWAAIHINFPCARGLKEILPNWLDRARNRSLSISLQGQLDEGVAAVIWGHEPRLKHLEICEVGDGERHMHTVKLWASRIPGPLPSLETLTIRGLHNGWGISSDHIFTLLLMAPNLVECLLVQTDLTLVLDDWGERLMLPKLNRLMFGESGTCPSVGDDLLDCLLLPALKSLAVTSDRLLPFLQRSSPPLVELVWGDMSGDDLAFGALAECLGLIPELGRFELWYPRCHVVEELIAALAESPSLLPHLHTLVVHLDEVDESDLSDHYFWTPLASALTARRTRFQAFQIAVPDKLSASQMPTPEIVATFGELAVDGTKVCISATIDTHYH